MSDHRPDIKGAVPLETQHITAECREAKNLYPAWFQAVTELLQVYYAQVERDPATTISLAIYRTPREETPLMTDEKARKSHLTTGQFAILNDACIPVTEAFGSPPYLVGSSTEHAEYRDVDLRLILTDEDFDHWFDGRVMLWSLICLTIGQYLASVTGLPIDFQIQRMTEANENHPGPSHRNPMGMRFRPLAGGGDATRFGAPA